MITYFSQINGKDNLFFNGSLDDFIKILQDFEWVELFQMHYNKILGRLEKKSVYVATCTIESYEVSEYAISDIAFMISKSIDYRYDDVLATLKNWGIVLYETKPVNNEEYQEYEDDDECDNEEKTVKKNVQTLDDIICEIMDDPEIITLMNRLKDIYASDYAKRR